VDEFIAIDNELREIDAFLARLRARGMASEVARHREQLTRGVEELLARGRRPRQRLEAVLAQWDAEDEQERAERRKAEAEANGQAEQPKPKLEQSQANTTSEPASRRVGDGALVTAPTTRNTRPS
jgi:hypothetical protein